MRTSIAAVATCLVIAACEPRDVPATAEPGTVPPATEAEVERAGFVLLSGDDTVAIERFARFENELRGSLHDVRRAARIDYTAAFDASGRVTGMIIDIVEPGAYGPTERSRVRLRGDTVFVLHADDGDGEQHMLVPPDATIYLNPSIALLELLLERARHQAEEPATFPVLTLEPAAEPRVLEPVIRRDGSVVHITLARGRVVQLQVENATRILSGENVGEPTRFERLR
jgi:hypothetical protein